MRKIEVTAKTRQEAIESALLKLGVERDEVHVEILDEGSSGFFGLGSRPVRIQVTAEHLPDEPPARSQRPPRQEAREQRPRQPQPQSQTPRPQPPQRQPQQQAPAPRGGAPSGARTQGPSRPERSGNRPDRPDRPPRPEPRGERSPRPERADRPERQERRSVPRPERPAEPTEPKAPREPLSEARVLEAVSLLEQMIQKMNIEAKVTATQTEDAGLCLTVESPDSAILIGRKGRNLAAMQYLINRMVHTADQPEDSDRIVIDIEGYIERRRTSLEEMARDMAARVRESGRKLRLRPLSPQERRIIHMTLQDDPDVKTYSVGEAAERTVIIAPRESSAEGESGERGRGGSRRGGRRRPLRRPDDQEQRPEDAAAAPMSRESEES